MNDLKKIYAILTSAERRKLVRLTFALLLMGMLEVVGVASILPFMQLVADPDVVERNEIMVAIVDYFNVTNTRQLILAAGGLVIALTILVNVVAVYTNWLKYHTSWKLVHQLSKRLMAGYLRRPYKFFLNTPTTEISSYVLAEVHGFASGVVVPIVDIVGRVAVALVIFGLLLWVDLKIALVMFGTLGTSYVIIFLLQRKMLTRLGELRIAANIQRYRALREVFDGIKTVKVFNRQGFFYNHFAEASDKFSSLQPKYQVLVAAPKNVLEILAFGTIVCITIYLYLSAGNFRAVVPTLSLYAVAGYRLLPALQKAFQALGSYRHNLPVVEKLYESVSQAPADHDFPKKGPLPLPLTRELVLRNLTYQYEGAERPALTKVNLSIYRGETVAFVGSTGSGKTTLIDQMVGLLEPSQGEVLVDDTPLNADNRDNWRASLAYVPQDVFLFDDTILNNVLMGADAGAMDVEKALDLADIGDFVRNLPDGLHTMIGEKGVRLSGGQRQRLGLARALFSNPSVLILDEATSALDNVTERGIIDALQNLPQDITTIVIAHRLSTVQHANRIFFLEHGQLIDQGTYEQLVDTNPAFAQMAQLA
ncbi:MAG: ABC transporter ATP-binding protein [Bacteroidota bacterium]